MHVSTCSYANTYIDRYTQLCTVYVTRHLHSICDFVYICILVLLSRIIVKMYSCSI